MLSHQVGRVLQACSQSCNDIRLRGGITQGHGDIPQPLVMADAMDGTACQAGMEGGFVPGKQFGERGIIQVIPY